MPLNRLGLSGNHITILGVTAILAITSGTVWSVSAYTNVAIQDPVSGRKAALDPQRQVLVRDTRASTDLIQANFIRFWRGTGSTECLPIATPPNRKALVIKSITVNTYAIGTPGSEKVATFYVGTVCSNVLATVNPPGIGVESINFEPGIVVPEGQYLWGAVSPGVQSEFYGSGYSIPSAWAPPSVPVSAGTEPGLSRRSPSALGNGG